MFCPSKRMEYLHWFCFPCFKCSAHQKAKYGCKNCVSRPPLVYQLKQKAQGEHTELRRVSQRNKCDEAATETNITTGFEKYNDEEIQHWTLRKYNIGLWDKSRVDGWKEGVGGWEDVMWQEATSPVHQPLKTDATRVHVTRIGLRGTKNTESKKLCC